MIWSLEAASRRKLNFNFILVLLSLDVGVGVGFRRKFVLGFDKVFSWMVWYFKYEGSFVCFFWGS